MGSQIIRRRGHKALNGRIWTTADQVQQHIASHRCSPMDFLLLVIVCMPLKAEESLPESRGKLPVPLRNVLILAICTNDESIASPLCNAISPNINKNFNKFPSVFFLLIWSPFYPTRTVLLTICSKDFPHVVLYVYLTLYKNLIVQGVNL